MHSFTSTSTLILATTFFVLSGCAPEPQPESNTSVLSEAYVDQAAEHIMAEYQIPGMAVAVVQDGNVVHMKGYGEREFGTGLSVTPTTLFKIASVSKNFTTAALARLVDEGKIAWDDPVRKHMPEFKMADSWVTEEFTIRDMLIHNSGLNLGAGDLMFWPEPNDFTRQDILHGLQFLPLTSSFRSEYAYDNLMYVLAGELTERVAGMPWEQFIEQQLMQPLGMDYCFAGPIPEYAQAHLAQPHAVVDGKPKVVRRDAADTTIPSAPAGGIRCSVQSLTQWMKMQLNSGTLAADDGKIRIIEAATHKEMWSPQTIMPVSQRAKAWDSTHFSAYGLGWRLNDFDGYLRVHHTGSLHGMYSYLSFFPELDVGMVVLMNRASSDARDAMMYSLIKPYTGDTKTDWLAKIKQWRATISQQREREFQPPQTNAVSETKAQPLLGTYRDPWFGMVTVSYEAGRLQWRSHRSPRLIGELLHVDNDTYIARWDDRTLYGDAYVQFKAFEEKQPHRMLMAPVDPATDFSFDYEDLNFTRVVLQDNSHG